MRTIFVTYSDVVLSEEEAWSKQKFAFNTDSNLEVGDRIKTDSYRGILQVVCILDECYKYVNTQTGEVSNSIKSTKCLPIKTLDIASKSSNVVGYLEE